MRVAALAEDDLLHLELPGGLGVPHRHARELRIVVPQAVVDGVVAGEFARHRPSDARGFEDDGEGHRVLGPREDLAGVVDEQDVGAFLVPRRLDREAGLLLHLLVDELRRCRCTARRSCPVDEPVRSCSIEPFSWISLGAMPISMLKSLRISCVSRALSTPIGQACAQRRQRVQRYADSSNRPRVAAFSSMCSPLSHARALPPGLAYSFTRRRKTSLRNVGRYTSSWPLRVVDRASFDAGLAAGAVIE